jgi:hypothetical protein
MNDETEKWRRVEQIYHEALELPADRRAASPIIDLTQLMRKARLKAATALEWLEPPIATMSH